MRLKAEPLLHKDTLISKLDGREAEQNLPRGSKAADYNEYLIFFFIYFFFKMLSFVKYPYIAAQSCHLYSDLSSPPYCL